MARAMLHILGMKIRFEKNNKHIHVEELFNKVFVSDGRHSYQIDNSKLDGFIEKIIARGYRSVIHN